MHYRIAKAAYGGRELYYVKVVLGTEEYWLDKHGEICIHPKNRVGDRKYAEAKNRLKNYEKAQRDFIPLG